MPENVNLNHSLETSISNNLKAEATRAWIKDRIKVHLEAVERSPLVDGGPLTVSRKKWRSKHNRTEVDGNGNLGST